MIKKFLKKHRKIAEFIAKSLGYFWIDCPVCKQKFAGFEIGGCIVERIAMYNAKHNTYSISHTSCVCSKTCEDHYIKTRINFPQKLGDMHE